MGTRGLHISEAERTVVARENQQAVGFQEVRCSTRPGPGPRGLIDMDDREAHAADPDDRPGHPRAGPQPPPLAYRRYRSRLRRRPRHDPPPGLSVTAGLRPTKVSRLRGCRTRRRAFARRRRHRVRRRCPGQTTLGWSKGGGSHPILRLGLDRPPQLDELGVSQRRTHEAGQANRRNDTGPPEPAHRSGQPGRRRATWARHRTGHPTSRRSPRADADHPPPTNDPCVARNARRRPEKLRRTPPQAWSPGQQLPLATRKLALRRSPYRVIEQHS